MRVRHVPVSNPLIEQVFDTMTRVPFHPHEPVARHVWVRTTGEHGPPVAGVVLQWQHAPLHNAGGSAWQALVATTPFADALVVGWVDASRLVELRDPSPAL